MYGAAAAAEDHRKRQGLAEYDDDLVRESEVWDINLPWWDAFHQLCAGRQLYGGMEVGYQPLNYSHVRDYAIDFGFGDTTLDLQEFMSTMYELDGIFLRYHLAKAEERRKRRATTNPRTKGGR